MDRVQLAAELLLAVSGPFPTGPLSPADADAAQALAKEWATRVKAWLAPDAKRVKPGRTVQVNYLATWNRLNQRHADDQVILGIDSTEIAQAYLGKLRGAREYLRAQWRPLALDTVAGRKILVPGLSETQRASAVYAAVAGRTTVLDGLISGGLEAQQAEAFRACFPMVFEMARALAREAIFKQVTRRKGYEVPYHAEQSLRVLLGLPMGQPIQALNQPPKAPAAPKLDLTIKAVPKPTRAGELSEGKPV